MDFPGFDVFEPTAPLLHAIFTIREEIPEGCYSIQVDFEQPGVVLCAAYNSDGTDSDVDVELSDEARAAAGLLLEYVSYQLVMMTRMVEGNGDEAVFAAQGRLRDSLAEFGLKFGLLDETLVDTVTIARR